MTTTKFATKVTTMTTTMTFPMKALFAGILFASTAICLPACGPMTPVSPTWKDDVRPLVLARCVRCHDNPPTNLAPFSLNYAEFSQIPPPAVPPAPPNYAPGPFLNLLGKAAHGTGFRRRMPPPPSAALEDWQLEILDNWDVNPH